MAQGEEELDVEEGNGGREKMCTMVMFISVRQSS